MYDIFEQLRQKRGVSVYKIAKETGVTQSTLSDWKRGRSTPKTDNMKKLADYFGVSIDYLTAGEEPESEKTNINSQAEDRDIAKRFDDIIDDINDPDGSPLYFDGVELDDKAKEIMATFMTNLKQQFELMKEMTTKK